MRRKIGAEIEVPQAHIDFPGDLPVTQGEKVGALVPGIEVEIHLENPDDGYATFELATGLHEQLPPESPLSMAYQAGYLGTWVETGEMMGRQRLADRALVELEPKWAELDGGQGPELTVGEGAKGAFQVNVSPTTETAPTLLSFFDEVHAFSRDPGSGALVEQAAPVNQALADARTYSAELFAALVRDLAGLADRDVPPRLVTALKALSLVPRVTYFRYLRSLEGMFSPTRDIIDKNIVEVLPRADLGELFAKAVLDDPTVDWKTLLPGALETAVAATPFPRIDRITVAVESPEAVELKRKMDGLRDLMLSVPLEQAKAYYEEATQLSQRYEKLVQEGSQEIDRPGDAEGLRSDGLSDMLAVLNGEKVLVHDRAKKGTPQPPAILKGTDSSLRPVNREQGEAGVYEVRNPFTEQIPPADWGEVMARYEAELRRAGVRY